MSDSRSLEAENEALKARMEQVEREKARVEEDLRNYQRRIAKDKEGTWWSTVIFGHLAILGLFACVYATEMVLQLTYFYICFWVIIGIVGLIFKLIEVIKNKFVGD